MKGVTNTYAANSMVLTSHGFVVFGPPSGPELQLQMGPRLESWDAKTARSQVELANYLDYLATLVKPALNTEGDPLGLALKVGLPAGKDILAGGRDLDNFLFPILRRLGHQRFVSAQAEKGYGNSEIRIGPVVPTSLSEDWHFAAASSKASVQYRIWKERIQAQVATQVPEPESPRSARDGDVLLRRPQAQLDHALEAGYRRPQPDSG